MIDIVDALLEHYYGFFKNPEKMKRFLSIYECKQCKKQLI